MITKIKKFVSKVTIVEWVILGIAVLALFVGLTHTHGKHSKASHGGNKGAETASVEVAPVAK